MNFIFVASKTTLFKTSKREDLLPYGMVWYGMAINHWI